MKLLAVVVLLSSCGVDDMREPPGEPGGDFAPGDPTLTERPDRDPVWLAGEGKFVEVSWSEGCDSPRCDEVPFVLEEVRCVDCTVTSARFGEDVPAEGEEFSGDALLAVVPHSSRTETLELILRSLDNDTKHAVSLSFVVDRATEVSLTCFAGPHTTTIDLAMLTPCGPTRAATDSIYLHSELVTAGGLRLQTSLDGRRARFSALETATREASHPELDTVIVHEFDAARLATLTEVEVEVPITPISIGDTTFVRGSAGFPDL
jgi:hypothetical protein